MRRLPLLLGLLATVAALAEPAPLVGRVLSVGDDALRLTVTTDGRERVVVLEAIGLPAGLKRGEWVKVTAADGRAGSVERTLSPRAAALKEAAGPLTLGIAVTGPAGGTELRLSGLPNAAIDQLAAAGLQGSAGRTDQPALAGPACRLTLAKGNADEALALDLPWTEATRGRLAALSVALAKPPPLEALLAQTRDWPVAMELDADLHDGYFVSGEFEVEEAGSFVLLADKPAFDRVFGAGFVMNDPFHRLPANAFAQSIVLAAIHEGFAWWTYDPRAVKRFDGVLRLDYTASSRPTPGTGFACPLIVRVPRAADKAVEFCENGKLVKRLAP